MGKICSNYQMVGLFVTFKYSFCYIHCYMFDRFWFTFFLSFFCISTVQATHYRAGEIIYQLVAPQTYRCSVITYTKTSSFAADRDTVQINWGDGTVQTIPRVNGPMGVGGFPIGEELANDIKKNIYIGQHTYASIPPPPYNFYVISFYDQNRIDGINNIDNGNSVEIPFYVEDTLKFPTDVANIGLNNSPILLTPPIDYANVNDTFYHNPNAYDPDGDSLTFTLITPLQFTGLTVPVYLYPQQYLPGPFNTSVLNAQTGEYIWAVPPGVGVFNIAILVREYRNGVHLGTLIRDMQIIVLNEPNDPPQIANVPDTCIHAGSLLRMPVFASDPQSFQSVTLSADGGPFFTAVSPATFTGGTANPVNGLFQWQTRCDHIRNEPWQVVFKAEDNYFSAGTPKPLVDLETWNIQVVAPPVEGVSALASGGAVTISWNAPYSCASSPQFRGFSVWRKDGCDTFTVGNCETGLAGRGFSRIADNVVGYQFTDNTVMHGKSYTYAVLAEFSRRSPNGIFEFDRVLSVPSNQVCVFLPFDVPSILHVDVVATDSASGIVFMDWARPKAGPADLDTLQNPPPYRFEIWRSAGFIPAVETNIKTVTFPSYSAITDTTCTDSLLNTIQNPYTYRILFLSNQDTVGDSDPASSVRLLVNATNQTLVLSWQYQVPWENDSFIVYRKSFDNVSFDSVAVVTANQYVDTGLVNDSVYCYYVTSYGHYPLGDFRRPLVNRSQIQCAAPIDTVPPCVPELSVSNDCELYRNTTWGDQPFVNTIRWAFADPLCSQGVVGFRIYYAPDQQTAFILLDEVASDVFSYAHLLETGLAGCYAVTAVDIAGNESDPANRQCVESCPFYELPNTFTPNEDGANDLFTPISPWRFVDRIDITITNRWGNIVFKTANPAILWDGKDYQSKKEVSDGVYFFAGHYEIKTLQGVKHVPFSSSSKGGGFIHLIRGKP